jgi:putative flippase GtrA
MKQKLVTEFIQVNRFILVGCGAVVIDFLVYLIFSTIINTFVSKFISFIIGSGFAYLLNKYWTFSNPKNSVIEIIKFSTLYGTTLIVNVVTNHYCINEISLNKLISFLIATSLSTIINFIGQKWWVFKND